MALFVLTYRLLEENLSVGRGCVSKVPFTWTVAVSLSDASYTLLNKPFLWAGFSVDATVMGLRWSCQSNTNLSCLPSLRSPCDGVGTLASRPQSWQCQMPPTAVSDVFLTNSTWCLLLKPFCFLCSVAESWPTWPNAPSSPSSPMVCRGASLERSSRGSRWKASNLLAWRWCK